ncbi:MAG: hypothetical protein ACLQAT_12350 [Candidatus Binataceae bacterium]
MATIDSRLDQIENALTPKQAVIAWLEQAHKFDSFEDYYDWLLAQLAADFPTRFLSQQIETSIVGRTKGQDPKNIQKAVHLAVRSVSFLFFLCLSVVQDFASRSREIALLGTLASESLYWAQREAKKPTHPDLLGTYRHYFEMYAVDVFSVAAAIEYLAREYLDGHQMLWKSQVDELNYHLGLIEALALGWKNDVFSTLKGSRKRGKPGSKSRIPRELDFDLEEWKTLIPPIVWTRNLIKGAKADALGIIGGTVAAIGQVRSQAQTESFTVKNTIRRRPVVPRRKSP